MDIESRAYVYDKIHLELEELVGEIRNQLIELMNFIDAGQTEREKTDTILMAARLFGLAFEKMNGLCSLVYGEREKFIFGGFSDRQRKEFVQLVCRQKADPRITEKVMEVREVADELAKTIFRLR